MYVPSLCVSESLRPHGLQHTMLSRPSVSPEFDQTHVHVVSDATNHLTLCCPLQKKTFHIGTPKHRDNNPQMKQYLKNL